MVHAILKTYPSETSLSRFSGDLRVNAGRIDKGEHHVTERVFSGKKVKSLKYKSYPSISDLCALDIGEIVHAGTTEQVGTGRWFVEKSENIHQG
jgi:hypothetical protein